MKPLLVATSRSGFLPGFRMLSSVSEPPRRIQTRVRNSQISSAVTSLTARYTCARGAAMRMAFYAEGVVGRRKAPAFLAGKLRRYVRCDHSVDPSAKCGPQDDG